MDQQIKDLISNEIENNEVNNSNVEIEKIISDAETIDVTLRIPIKLNCIFFILIIPTYLITK